MSIRRKKSKYFVIIFISLMITAVYAEDKGLSFLKKTSYVYRSAGKPDPFKPFITKESYYKSLLPEELKRLKIVPTLKTELQRIKLSDLKIVAMVKTKDGVLAMVEGPTGKGYIVRPGMGIGMKGGVVYKIIYKDVITPLGKKAIRKIVIKEPFIDKNKKISFRYVEMSMNEKNIE